MCLRPQHALAEGPSSFSSISGTDRADTGRGLNGSKRQNVTSIAYKHYVGSIESSTAPVTRNAVSLGADWPHKVATPRMVGYYENEILLGGRATSDKTVNEGDVGVMMG